MVTKLVPLGALAILCLNRVGRHFGTPRVYSITKHSGFVPSLEYFKKQVFSRNLASYNVVEPGDFAYATIHLDEGAIGIAPEYGAVSPMYTVFRVVSRDVHSPYLLRFLRSPRALAQYQHLGQGSAERRRTISFRRLADLLVPLPSVSEQRRIVAVLDQVDALRAKRREVLAQLRVLGQSVYVEMFGDSAAGSRNWPIVPVRDFVEKFEGGRNVVADDLNAASTYRVLKVSAVTSLTYDPSESKPAPVGYRPPPRHLVRPGDLLFSRANTAELVGATAYVGNTPLNTLLPDKLWRFVWRRPLRVHPLYVHSLFSQPTTRRLFSALATGSSGSMKNISQVKVLSVLVRLPPWKIQFEFARRVEAIERLKEKQRAHLAEMDALFASLQHRGFRGEL